MKIVVHHIADHIDGARTPYEMEVPTEHEKIHADLHYRHGIFFLVRQLSKERKERRHAPECASLKVPPVLKVKRPVRFRHFACNCDFNKATLPGDLEVSMHYADAAYKTVTLSKGEGMEAVPAIVHDWTENFNEPHFAYWLAKIYKNDP